MVLAKSKFDKKSGIFYQSTAIVNKKIEKITKEVLFAKKNETIILLSKSNYSYKDGHFYVAINSNNKRFFIDESEVQLMEEDLNFSFNFENKEISFNEYLTKIQNREFSL